MWVFLGFVGREYKQVFWRLISYLEESFRVGVGRRGGLLPRRKATEGEIGIISFRVDCRNLISLYFSFFLFMIFLVN